MGQGYINKGWLMKWDEIYFWLLGILAIIAFYFAVTNMPISMLDALRAQYEIQIRH
jgi:hypothetical protein